MPTDCSAGPSAPAPPNSSAAHKQRIGIPAREDHQRDRHQALPAGQSLVPAPRVVEREERAADAGEEAARPWSTAMRTQVDRVRPWRAPRRPLSPADAHDQAPARVGARPKPCRRRQHDADEEQRVDLQRGRDLRAVAPPAERDRAGSRGAVGWM